MNNFKFVSILLYQSSKICWPFCCCCCCDIWISQPWQDVTWTKGRRISTVCGGSGSKWSLKICSRLSSNFELLFRDSIYLMRPSIFNGMYGRYKIFQNCGIFCLRMTTSNRFVTSHSLSDFCLQPLWKIDFYFLDSYQDEVLLLIILVFLTWIVNTLQQTFVIVASFSLNWDLRHK